MKKGLLCILIAILFSSLPCSAKTTTERKFSEKFSTLKKVSKYCDSSNEKTSIVALNSLRNILFRDQSYFYGESNKNSTDLKSFRGLSDKMNSDVDKVYIAVKNLENSLELANPKNPEDSYLIKLIRYLIVSEIAMIIRDDSFFATREKIQHDIQLGLRFINSAMYLPPEEGSSADIKVFDRLSNLIDLADYIYREQINWLMKSSYSIQRLIPTSNTTVIQISKPPRIYIPGNTNDYIIKGMGR